MKKLTVISVFTACLLLQSCDWLPWPPDDDPDPDDPECEWDTSINNPGITGLALIYTPDPDHTTASPKLLVLPDSILLASFTEAPVDGPGEPVVRFHKGYDLGRAWTHLSSLSDTHRGQGFRDPEPFLMPDTMGSVPAGTVLCGVTSWQEGSPSYIDVYRSDDEGLNWEYMSTVASGNGMSQNVYHPFFLIDRLGRLLCYYSDERDPAHARKIVYQASEDGGYTWSEPVDVVALADPSARPGMARADKFYESSSSYVMAYEYAGYPDPEIDSPIHIKRSTDGYTWGDGVDDPGRMITTSDGAIPGGSPSITWRPYGSAEATMFVSARIVNPEGHPCGSPNFYNRYGGLGRDWYELQQPLPYDPQVENAGLGRQIMAPDPIRDIMHHINCVEFTDRNTEVWYASTYMIYE